MRVVNRGSLKFICNPLYSISIVQYYPSSHTLERESNGLHIPRSVLTTDIGLLSFTNLWMTGDAR